MCTFHVCCYVNIITASSDVERVDEKDVQFDTICRLQKEMMWSEKLAEENILEMTSEVEALKMRLRTLEEAAKRDQTRINSLEVECESHKRQLGASLSARQCEREAASKTDQLVETLLAEVMSLKIQLGKTR